MREVYWFEKKEDSPSAETYNHLLHLALTKAGNVHEDKKYLVLTEQKDLRCKTILHILDAHYSLPRHWIKEVLRRDYRQVEKYPSQELDNFLWWDMFHDIFTEGFKEGIEKFLFTLNRENNVRTLIGEVFT